MRNQSWLRCPDCNDWVATPGEDQITTPYFVATCPHCGLEFDWRSKPHHEFLTDAIFYWDEFIAPSEAWDHEHCALCWQKFMELDHPEIERFGYVTHANRQEWWVCRDCFDVFREEFGWRVAPFKESPP